jgi:hypothetical protein
VKRAQPKWGSEAAMLVAFADVMRAMGFRVVPEACGHDVILVAGPELCDHGYVRVPSAIEPGDTVAVEGKLRGSLEVLRQAVPPFRHRGVGAEKTPAADFYAVVVPEYYSDFEAIANALDVCTWTMLPDGAHGWKGARLGRFDVPHAARVVGHPPLAVPSIDVAITPGCPSPRALTPWKIAAVRLCLLGEQRDLSAADFAGTPVRPRTFVDRRWMERASGKGQHATWRLLDAKGRPDQEYPEIAAAIVAQDPVVVEMAKGPLGALWSEM